MAERLIVIETEAGFIQQFRRLLKVEDLTDRYELMQVEPDTTLEQGEMVTACVDRIVAVSADHPIAAVFIDLVIVEGSRSGRLLDNSSVLVARRIRELIPHLPMFFITAHVSGDGVADAFSEGTLEDVDGAFLKSYVCGEFSSARRLKRILEVGIKRRKQAAGARVIDLFDSASADACSRKFSSETLDPRIRTIIRELGEVRFWHLLGKLFPTVHSGILRPMSQGRSGAIVLRASVVTELGDAVRSNLTHWVIKISRDRESLTRESSNYDALPTTGVSKYSLPRPLSGAIWTGDIGGLVVELQADADSLPAALSGAGLDEKRSSRFRESLFAAIRALHGSGLPEVESTWRARFKPSADANSRVLAFFAEMQPIAEQCGVSAQIFRVRQLVEGAGADYEKICSYAMESQIVFAHNDLNAGNVLVGADGTAVLIDFASASKGHPARDYAKFERDLFFRVLGFGSREYLEWVPKQVSCGAARCEVGAFEAVGAKHIGELACEVRKEATSGRNIPVAQYLMALCSQSLAALANSRLPVQRRIAGIAYVDTIIEQLLNEVQ